MPAIRGGIIDAHISPLGGASQQQVKVDEVILKTASTMVGRLISFWYSCGGAGREDEVMMRDSRASEMCFTFMLLMRWLGAALGEDEIARWAIDAAAAAICAFIVDPAWFAPTWTANAPAEQVCADPQGLNLILGAPRGEKRLRRWIAPGVSHRHANCEQRAWWVVWDRKVSWVTEQNSCECEPWDWPKWISFAQKLCKTLGG